MDSRDVNCDLDDLASKLRNAGFKVDLAPHKTLPECQHLQVTAVNRRISAVGPSLILDDEIEIYSLEGNLFADVVRFHTTVEACATIEYTLKNGKLPDEYDV